MTFVSSFNITLGIIAMLITGATIVVVQNNPDLSKGSKVITIYFNVIVIYLIFIMITSQIQLMGRV